MVAVEEGDGLVDDEAVVLGGDGADAGGVAAADVVLEAGAVVDLVHVEGAGAVGKDAVEELEYLAQILGARVGAEVAGAVADDAAGGEDAGVGFGGGDLEIEVLLVVAEDDVVARLVALDEVVFENQGFDFGVGEDEIEVGDAGDEATGLGVESFGTAEVGTDAAAQGKGLTDVDDVAGGVVHEVDAGGGGEGGEFAVDQFGGHDLPCGNGGFMGPFYFR